MRSRVEVGFGDGPCPDRIDAVFGAIVVGAAGPCSLVKDDEQCSSGCCEGPAGENVWDEAC